MIGILVVSFNFSGIIGRFLNYLMIILDNYLKFYGISDRTFCRYRCGFYHTCIFHLCKLRSILVFFKKALLVIFYFSLKENV